MEKSELRLIKPILDEIASLEKQIKNLEKHVKPTVHTDIVKGSSACFPYGARTFKIEGVDLTDYDRQLERIRNQYQWQLKNLMEFVARANEFIAEQEGPEIRNILRLRYVNGLEWKEIAKEVHMCEKTARSMLGKWWGT
jgi:hypothetical protein